MSKYYIYYIFFSFLFSGIIQHSHITSVIENSPINIEVLINIEYDNIRKVTLFYQSNNQKNFLELNMKHTRDNFFSSTIPAEYVSNNGINYYILLELNDNTIFSFPTENPVDNPISNPIYPDGIPCSVVNVCMCPSFENC